MITQVIGKEQLLSRKHQITKEGKRQTDNNEKHQSEGQKIIEKQLSETNEHTSQVHYQKH